ncbi:hypothetical protein [Mycobacteroides chelonae]|uniref:hypothetical protein n=1 Tax=Mycobacteroides chelonae TaxID=1774 RepID=UPI0008A9C851|nr:hypothetical protein [Mycobacteroides chelonae]AYM41643.1 hypothetical protein DYE20_08885 [[Mycobacterium] chelonae subsp. gwanakae]OHU11946.1 hypothetical protein BKG75_20420 [Mycobacteroides chelonae]
MKHGVAGFQSGCRCVKCFTDETQRAQDIAEAQFRYWEPINEAADESWTSRWRLRTPQRSNVRSWASHEIALARDRSIPARKVAARLGRTLSAVNAMRYRPVEQGEPEPIESIDAAAVFTDGTHQPNDEHSLIMEIPTPLPPEENPTAADTFDKQKLP